MGQKRIIMRRIALTKLAPFNKEARRSALFLVVSARITSKIGYIDATFKECGVARTSSRVAINWNK